MRNLHRPGAPEEPGGREDDPGDDPSQRKDQPLAALITEEELADFEAQARAWVEAEDGVEEASTWSMERGFVHMQILDRVASGAGGRANVSAIIRAGRAFTEDTVKLFNAIGGGPDGEDEAEPAPVPAQAVRGARAKTR